MRVRSCACPLLGSDPGRILTPGELPGRARYELITSLVVPRPIGWISTVSERRVPNLAPFSFFSALSASPMLVGVAIGPRRTGQPKDSLANVREHPWFCVNVVTIPQIELMNQTSAELPPEASEFHFGGVKMAWHPRVEVPFVEDCPAVLVCRMLREVGLEPSPSSLLIGEVQEVRLAAGLTFEEGSYRVRPEDLPAVGRLGGAAYVLPGELRELARPRVPES